MVENSKLSIGHNYQKYEKPVFTVNDISKIIDDFRCKASFYNKFKYLNLQ
ncbi:hypothetical protein MNV_1190008 [Candidatus Methanoperedens nitroreducens]|uniref:Uncharacterized protein n=1 Tax=Candidatus Methanoperedens nitratireducens TaxID=1392998 RepID=A0A284VJG6_9EURY|nr:hypothetical protein MNV_1190008 [Candidatus Methanoperedens nitroreducens]